MENLTMKRQEPLPLLVWVGAKHSARPVNYLNLLSAYGWSWRKRKEWALKAQRPNTGIANAWHTWPQHVSPTTGSMAGCPAFTWDFPTLPSTRIQAPAEADLGPCYMASLDSHAVTWNTLSLGAPHAQPRPRSHWKIWPKYPSSVKPPQTLRG